MYYGWQRPNGNKTGRFIRKGSRIWSNEWLHFHFQPPWNSLKEKDNSSTDFLLGHSMNLPVLNHWIMVLTKSKKNRRHFQVPGFSLAMGFYAEKFCRRIEISTNSKVFPNKIRLFLIVFTVSKWWATILPDLGEKEINRLQLNCIYLLI